MFPGCLSNSQLLQDIRDNYRAQTLVSVPGFTAKHHMFVQPLASRRAPPSSTSSREPLSSSSPVSSELRIEYAASSTTQSYGAGGTATALFVPSWVTYHGVVRVCVESSISTTTKIEALRSLTAFSHHVLPVTVFVRW